MAHRLHQIADRYHGRRRSGPHSDVAVF